MKQKADKKLKSYAFTQDMKIDRPRTRARVKQEADDSKEYLKCALCSPVKIEAPSL